MKKNVGLCILRAWMCFEVILSHFWRTGVPGTGLRYLFLGMRAYHVPVFMFMSMYLTADMFFERGGVKLKKRLKRLAFPHIFWGCAYYLIYKLLSIAGLVALDISTKDLFWQLITGHSQNLDGVLWYQVNLIWLTVLFSIIVNVWKSGKKWIVFGMLSLFSLVLQYSGVNLLLWGDMCFELRYPLGRLIEMLPIAVCGLMAGYFKVFERIKDILPRKNLIIGLFLIVSFLTIYPVFTVPEGYGYAGVEKFIVAGCFVFLFWLLPFERCTRKIRNVIIVLTDYTLGIYCLHFGIHNLVCWFVQPRYGWPEGSFLGCCGIYIICYLLSMLIAHLSIKGCVC